MKYYILTSFYLLRVATKHQYTKTSLSGFDETRAFPDKLKACKNWDTIRIASILCYSSFLICTGVLNYSTKHLVSNSASHILYSDRRQITTTSRRAECSQGCENGMYGYTRTGVILTDKAVISSQN